METEPEINKPIDIADVPPNAIFKIVLQPGEGDVRRHSYYRPNNRSHDLGIFVEVRETEQGGWEDIKTSEDPPTISGTFFSTRGQQVLVVASL